MAIQKPGLSKGYNRNEYLGENKPPTVRDQLRDLMDAALSAGNDFDGFLLLVYADLVNKTAAVTAEYDNRLTRIKAIETRLGEISELQKHIRNYSKYREVYTQYKASGWNEDFFETHRAALTLHKAAKNYFDN